MGPLSNWSESRTIVVITRSFSKPTSQAISRIWRSAALSTRSRTIQMSKSDSHVAIPRAREPKAQILAPGKCLRIRVLNSFKIFLSAWDIKVSPLFLFFSKPQVVFHVIHGRKWNYLLAQPRQGHLKVPFEVIPKGGRNPKSSLELNLSIGYNGCLSLHDLIDGLFEIPFRPPFKEYLIH